MSDIKEEVFEIGNPSDPYTIRAPYRTACAATLLLGKSAYGLTPAEETSPDLAMPPFLFASEGQLEKWVFDVFGCSVDDLLRPKEEIADALDSVLIGKYRDRLTTEAAVQKMTPEDAKAWLAERHDQLRTSMNDIGEYASELAAYLRE